MPDRFPAELPMQFATTSDGVRIAFGVVGEGPTCIYARSPHRNHTQLAWEMPILRAGNRLLAERLRIIMFDSRNTGLSQWTNEGFSVEAGMRDLDAVISATATGPVSLLCGWGAAKAAVPYAASNPERVSRLVLFSAGVNGWAPRDPASTMLDSLWEPLAKADPKAASRLMTRTDISWTGEDLRHWDEYMARTTPVEYQARCRRLVASLDVSEYLPLVECPVLVVQPRHLSSPTLEEQTALASSLKRGRLVVIDGRSYVLETELGIIPTVVDFLREEVMSAKGHPGTNGRTVAALSGREIDVLALIAAGRTNPQIADALTIAPATAARHVHNILEKLGMSRRSEAAAYALREGLVD